jgi:hypothetical protein
LISDHRGQFRGNWAASNCARQIPSWVIALLREPRDVFCRLERLYAAIRAMLEDELRAAGYTGPLGIDAFVYRGADGRCRVKPIVEVNPRYTMGRLTLELMRRTSPGTHGLLRLVNPATARREGEPDLASFAQSLSRRHPLRTEGHPVPQLREGSLCLNDPACAQGWLATFQAARRLDDLVPADRPTNGFLPCVSATPAS